MAKMKNWAAVCLVAGAFLCQAGDVAAPKKAGVAFRFDDNKPAALWKNLAALFDRYDYKLSYAVTSQKLRANTPEVEALREISARGHRVIDHVPSHAIYQIQARNQKEFDEFSKLPFTDHADPKTKTVFFKCEVDLKHPRTLKFQGEIKNGELTGFPADMAKHLGFSRKIYIPATGKMYGIRMQQGKRMICSFWRENIKVPDYKGEIVIPTGITIQPSDELLRFQAQVTRNNFKAFGLPLPKVWAQPGGWENYVSLPKIRKIYGKEFGYNSADSIPGHSKARDNSFGDPDPEWGRYQMCVDFTGLDNGQDIRAMKAKIAEAVAKNRVKIFISHIWIHRVKGGWDAYAKGYEELFAWLKKHQIPVKTQEEWAEVLYSGKSGLAGNIMPSLKTDIDEDGKPDGYDFKAGLKCDLKTGVVTIPPGKKLHISDLAGLQKGPAEFSLAVKGKKGTEVVLNFLFIVRKGKNYFEQRKFRLSGDDWEVLRGNVTVKPEAFTLHYGIQARGKDSSIEVRDPEFKH